ncbi:hypothetical protein D3C84_635150 [compost metagenome]
MLTNEFTGTVALGDRQGFAGHFIQGRGIVRPQASHQHIRAGEEWASEAQPGLTFDTGADPRHQIDLSGLERLQHVGDRSGWPYIELQAGAQTDFVQYISTDAAELAIAVDKRNRQDVFVHGHGCTGMSIEPTLLGLAQLQRLRTWHGRPVGAPSAQDIHVFIGAHRRQRAVDDAMQGVVVAGHRKRKATGLHGRKIGQLHVVEVILADQVMGADRVAQIDVRLLERHGPHRAQGGGKQLHAGLGIERLHPVFRQIMVQRRQPFAGQVRVQQLR